MSKMKKTMLMLMLVAICGCVIAGTVTKKIWLSINTGFEDIEDFRKQFTSNIDEVIEVEVTCGLVTKQFTYEEFFTRLGFLEPTNIIVILDSSGSMENIKDDMEGGLRRFIEDQKKIEDIAYLTLVDFSNTCRTVYESVDIKDITDISIVPFGGTALLDAIGETVGKPYLNRKTICVIITDGLENSSHTYSKDDVVSMIESKRLFGWKFIYLGANQDAIQEGSGLGINTINCSGFDMVNLNATLDTMSTTVSSFRTGAKDE